MNLYDLNETQGAEDEQYLRTVRITVTEKFRLAGSDPALSRTPLLVTPDSIASLAAAAVATYPEEWRAQPICVISGETSPAVSFATNEHFVPEGLGFPWAVLPRGVGTCDQVNHQFGKYEAEWLRQGLMGVFRSFFVADGKDGPPAYYAPSKDKRVLWFTRGPDGHRVLCFGPDVKHNLPDESGPGVLAIHVPRTQARPVWVSLALHKLALLALWLCRGSMVFDSGFTPLRAFFSNPNEANYRPFVSEMTTGAVPGVEVHLLVVLDGERLGDKARFSLHEVHARLRVHHMRYDLVLMGSHGALPDGSVWEPWRDPSEKPADTTPIQLRFEALMRRTQPQKEIAEAAYFRWLHRGGGDGGDQEDWFAAEQAMAASAL